jgi:L-iditol 2-dehydrogenase
MKIVWKAVRIWWKKQGVKRRISKMNNSVAILVEPKKMEIQAAAIPVPKSDEVLLKVEYVGICGSDIHGFEYGPFIPPQDPATKIGLGHECAGEVVEIGKDVTRFKVGDKVAIEPGIPCGKCRFCLEGKYNICPDVNFMATQPYYKGALTNYLTHPANMTYKLPDNMNTMKGALIEPAAVGMHAALEADARPGKKIVILGGGCIGLMTLQACKVMGATEIIVVDIIEKRLEMAKQLGAMEVINPKTADTVTRVKEIFGEWGADIVFETAGAQATARITPLLVMRGGKIMIVGTIPGETPIDFLKINREVSIQTVFRYANNYPMTIQAISSGRFDVQSMVTNIYDYEDVQKAFEESVSCKQDIIKGVIKVS